jgi:hypothetical protein
MNPDDIKINSPAYDSSFEPSFASHNHKNFSKGKLKSSSQMKNTQKGIFMKLMPFQGMNKPDITNIIPPAQPIKRMPFCVGQKQRLLSLGGEQYDPKPIFQQILSARNLSQSPPRISQIAEAKMTSPIVANKLPYRSSSNEKRRIILQSRSKVANNNPSQMSLSSSTAKHSKDWDIVLSDKKLVSPLKSTKINQNAIGEELKQTHVTSTDTDNSFKFTNLIQLSSSIRKQQQLKTVHIDLFKPTDSSLRASYSLTNHQSRPGSFLNIYSASLQIKMQTEIDELVTKITNAFSHEKSKFASDISLYRIGKVLGKGAFGKVNLGLHKLSGKLVAVKSINKKYITDIDSQKKVTREISILKKLKHPNVMRLYETFETDHHILLFTELCPAGDLLTYVRKRRKLKESIAKVILRQILDGLSYIHSKSILHRDIKLDNILLSMNGEIKVNF